MTPAAVFVQVTGEFSEGVACKVKPEALVLQVTVTVVPELEMDNGTVIPRAIIPLLESSAKTRSPTKSTRPKSQSLVTSAVTLSTGC